MPVYCGSSQPPSARWCRDQPARPRARPRRTALARGVQREQRPRGLRGGAGAAPDPGRVVVGAAVLAPAAVLVLVGSQPVDRAADAPGRRPGRRRRPARGTAGAGAVDVVDAPAPEPRAVGLLLVEQPARSRRGAVARRLAGPERASISTRVRGDVGARRVDHLAEVAERAARARARGCCRRRTRPSRRRRSASRRPTRTAAGDRPHRRARSPGDRRGAARARPRRCRRRRGSCRSRTRTPSRRAQVRPAHGPVAATR